MATTDNELNDLIINDISQEEYDNLVATGQVQEGQIYATDGTGSSGGGSTTGGLESVAHDSSLEGAGTTASPLKVASTVIAQINDKADSTVVETLSSVVSENTTKLNTLRNDTDSLGDQVSGIEEKIPSSASATNQLATKADLPIGFDATVVAELPTTGEKGIIYLVPKDGEAPDVHDEYIWIDSEQKFEFIGSTAVDLTDYVKNTDYAIESKGGVIKISSVYATATTSGGHLTGKVDDLGTYDKRASTAFVSKGTLENIKDDYVKRGITANTIALTDEEKTAAQDWLGIKQGASLPILMAMWSDHVISDMSWLRADTFSWQSGDVYVAAYEHLANDVSEVWYAWAEVGGGIWYTKTPTVSIGDTVYNDDFSVYGTVSTVFSSINFGIGVNDFFRSHPDDIPAPKTDTIGDITITYYLADDGHKICLPDQESNLVALYEATGVAWYYLLDTENKQFKLPRTKYGFTGLRDSVGNYVPESLPNITATFGDGINAMYGVSATGAATAHYANKDAFNYAGDDNSWSTKITIDASRSSSAYQNGAPVQERATQMYLYFYVGNFGQTAVEQTAGVTTETLNGKADIDLGNLPTNIDYVVESQEPTSSNSYTWYRKYKSGWVEQGGRVSLNGVISATNKRVTFPVEMANSKYNASVDTNANVGAVAYVGWESTTGMSVGLTSGTSTGQTSWRVAGMAKQ